MIKQMIKLLFTGWRLLLTPLALLATVALCSLGFWQISRLQERLALNEHIDTQMTTPAVPLDPYLADGVAFDYRVVTVRGMFDPSQEVLIRNRAYLDTTGYHVLTPLRIQGSDKSVLVDRGWVPLTMDTPEARKAAAPPSGEVTITGVARKTQVYTTGPQDAPFSSARPRLDAWFQVNIGRLQQQIGTPLVPVFVEQQPTSDVPQSLPIATETSDLGPGPHMGYAIQWFSFAIIMLVGYPILVYHNVYKPRQDARRAAADGELAAAAH